MLSDKEIAPIDSYFCGKHKVYKEINDTTGLYECLYCINENSDISNVRHKNFSDLPKIKPIYFFLVFSTIYSLFTFIFDLLILLISFLNINLNLIFLIKILFSGVLTYFFDKKVTK